MAPVAWSDEWKAGYLRTQEGNESAGGQNAACGNDTDKLLYPAEETQASEGATRYGIGAQLLVRNTQTKEQRPRN